MTLAVRLPWPGTTTVTVSAPCTTWLLVTISPFGLTTIPVPAAAPPPSRPSSTVFTSTTAGSVAAATAATSTVVGLVAVASAVAVPAGWAPAGLINAGVP